LDIPVSATIPDLAGNPLASLPYTGGEAAILAIDGFGRKSLADLKKRLRAFGYVLPEAAQEITA